MYEVLLFPLWLVNNRCNNLFKPILVTNKRGLEKTYTGLGTLTLNQNFFFESLLKVPEPIIDKGFYSIQSFKTEIRVGVNLPWPW